VPTEYRNTWGERRWRARWRTGTGERQSLSGFTSEKDARGHEEAMRTARRAGEPVRRPTTRLTVDGYWRRWWQEEVTVAKARATQYSYRDTYAASIGPRIGELKLREIVEDSQLLLDWRARLAREKSQSALDHAQRVLSSMLSAAAEEGLIPYNPLLLLSRQGRRGRRRSIGRTQTVAEPIAVDIAAWFLVVERLRRPTRPAPTGTGVRTRRYLLDREQDALIVTLGFMAGLRLPSEALGLTREDVRTGRLHVEGRSSSGEYTPGSKTGRGRDLPLQPLLAEALDGFLSLNTPGTPKTPGDFWICSRTDGGIWTEHQAHNWRQREFRPVARQVAADFPQFASVARASPYATRHTFISACLQAGISLATIAAWCGTSIQMISQTYGRMIRRHEGSAPVALDEQFRAGREEAMSLLTAGPEPEPGAADSQPAQPSAGRVPPARRRRGRA